MRVVAILNRAKNTSYAKFLPTLYGIILILGLVLTGLFVIFPGLSFCAQAFGEKFCSPAGVFVSVFASLPGYIIIGNIVTKLGEIHLYVSLILVILTSVVFYFLLGKLIDRIKKGKLTTYQIIKLIVFIAVIVLGILALSLV